MCFDEIPAVTSFKHIIDITGGIPLLNQFLAAVLPFNIPTLLEITARQLVEIVSDVVADIVFIKLEEPRDTETVSGLDDIHQLILDFSRTVQTLKSVLILSAKL